MVHLNITELIMGPLVTEIQHAKVMHTPFRRYWRLSHQLDRP